jgi:hypothetical protein
VLLINFCHILSSCRHRYEFFLFNDLLIYAKKAVTGKWHEHRRITNDGSFQFKDPDQNNQSVSSCSVCACTDRAPCRYRNGKVFEIYSKEKSFKVEAESEQAKQVWLDHFETCKKWFVWAPSYFQSHTLPPSTM